MSALPQPFSLITADQYLQQEREAESKSEYVNGQVYAMAGATVDHNVISDNCLMFLRMQLRTRPCQAFGSDMKVRVDKANVFRYPDVSALCGPVLFHDDGKDAYCNPSVIVEVLSPATERLDRGEKFMLYRLLDTLAEYVLVRQDRVEVEVFTKLSEGQWSSILYDELADSFHLRSVNCRLTLAEIYEKVAFA
ncbi:MAG TPA: Uma2 family endonuclease [Verrucomicrobiales bacterium]|nr:Uma2 family endonuclease [Verrucomicrobiales bacterium]